MTSGAARYDRVQVIFHWIIAAIILFMIVLGLYMVELPKKSELPPGTESVRAFYFLLHKSMGLTAAILIILRILWRFTHTAPALPDTLQKWQQKAAGLAHWLLYALMVAMPLSGYMQSIYSKYDTKFWSITLPRIADADKAMRENFSEVHEWLAFMFIGLIIIHIAAAIKHHFSNSGISDRMSLRKH